jgi:hypothetical protein
MGKKLAILVRLLGEEKRGEFSTTMQTAGKDVAVEDDLRILSSLRGPYFNLR